MGNREGQLWAIVLAAGEGRRLASISRTIHGHDVPKQFARIHGDRTFLQRTLDRIALLVPPERTVVVVADDQIELARQQLAGHPGVDIVRQPQDRGTAAGVLLPLAHVLHRDPRARVVIFPSDHHVPREEPFRDAVERALAASAEAPSGVTLVGAAGDEPSSDLGWIVCGAPVAPRVARARELAQFVEKPEPTTAHRLLRSGAVWNTLIVAADGRALWKLVRRHAPALVAALDEYRSAIGRPEARPLLCDVYRALPNVDFSRGVLEKAEGVYVVTMVDSGWSDCGTPDRLFRALAETGELAALRRRLDAAAAPPGRTVEGA